MKKHTNFGQIVFATITTTTTTTTTTNPLCIFLSLFISGYLSRHSISPESHSRRRVLRRATLSLSLTLSRPSWPVSYSSWSSIDVNIQQTAANSSKQQQEQQREFVIWLASLLSQLVNQSQPNALATPLSSSSSSHRTWSFISSPSSLFFWLLEFHEMKQQPS